MKNKFKIVRRGSRWCVRVRSDETDVFGRPSWPANDVAQWLEDYGIPHVVKQNNINVLLNLEIRNSTYVRKPKWDWDYLFECKEDVTWFKMRWL